MAKFVWIFAVSLKEKRLKEGLIVCWKHLFFDSSNLEHNRIIRIWTSIEYYIFVFAPWKLHTITHSVDFWKQNHQGTVADVAFYRFAIKDYLIADFVSESTYSLLTLYSNFYCGHANSP